MSRNRVTWSEIDPATYEDLTTTLVSILHPQTIRVDGSGGDGGRDCYWETPGGTEVWEMKSHSGRLGAPQRRQIERSLNRAAAHQPVKWHLVIPIDSTPGERAWFESISEPYSFPTTWHGRTWLDAQIAERPWLARYFLEGSEAEVIELLRELREEEAGLAEGAPQALDRIQRVVDQLNQVDPHWVFEIAAGPGHQSIQFIPRYPGAERDRPIRIGISLLPSDSDAQFLEIKEAFDFGLPVFVPAGVIDRLHVDVPAGLGGEFEGGDLSLTPAPVESPFASIVLEVSSEEGHARTRLPLGVKSVNRGKAGWMLTAMDRLGWIRAVLKLHVAEQRLEMVVTTNEADGALPAELGPGLAFLSSFRKPNVITVRSESPPVTICDGLPIEIESPFVSETDRRVIEDLARLQSLTGIHFELPDHLSPADRREIDEGLRLLDGESVPMKWSRITLNLTPVKSEPAVIYQAASRDEVHSMLSENSDVSVTVAEHQFNLGPARIHYPEVRIVNRSEVLENWDAGAPIAVGFECISQPTMQLKNPIASRR